MTQCSCCNETRWSRCSFADCPWEADDRDTTIDTQAAEIKALREEVERLKSDYLVTHGRAGERDRECFRLEAALAGAREALERASYLIDRYRTLYAGKPVRDLGEAESAFETALRALKEIPDA